MGFYTTMRMLGYVLGPLLGGLIYRYLGLNAAFIASTMIMLLAVLVVQFYVEDMPAAGVAAGRRFRIIDPVLLTPSIVSAGLAAFLIGSAFIMITSLENEFNSRLNISAFGFGIAFSFLMIGRVLFQVPLGRFSDRFGRKPFIFCGLLLLSPVTVLVGQAASLLQIILLRFAQGVAAAAIVAPALAMAADLSLPGGQSRQISIVPMGYGLGIACGPLLAGALSWVSFELPFWVAGLLSLAGAWLVYRNMLETVRPTGGGRSAAL
jgi:MFS family permease